MTELFNFNQHQIRVSVDETGEPWWVASDVAKTLGYREAEKLTRRLDDDEKGVRLVGTLGGDQQMTVISESGVYSAIIGSRLETAKAFKRWLTCEVLPAIRKTGSYSVDAAVELDREEILVMALEETRRAKALEALNVELTDHVASLVPAARAWEHLGDVATDYGVREAAQILSSDPSIDTGQRKLMATLRELKWVGQGNVPFQSHLEGGTGRLAAKVAVFTDADGVEHPRTTTRITHKGLTDLHRLLGGTAEFFVQEPLRLVVA